MLGLSKCKLFWFFSQTVRTLNMFNSVLGFVYLRCLFQSAKWWSLLWKIRIIKKSDASLKLIRCYWYWISLFCFWNSNIKHYIYQKKIFSLKIMSVKFYNFFQLDVTNVNHFFGWEISRSDMTQRPLNFGPEKRLKQNPNFINTSSQFHQRFLRAFFGQIFGAKPNVTRENNVRTKNLYVKCWWNWYPVIFVI